MTATTKRSARARKLSSKERMILIHHTLKAAAGLLADAARELAALERGAARGRK